jgi:hypothetical protein
MFVSIDSLHYARTYSTYLRIKRRQLKWYGNLLKMNYSPWSKEIYQWSPRGWWMRGRMQHNQGRRSEDFMRSRNMEEDMAGDLSG